MTQAQFPWPPADLLPNARRRHHWSRTASQAKVYRQTCWTLAKQALLADPGTPRIVMTITFYPPDNRRRDDDGMIGAFKEGRDGIALAMGVDDSRFRPTYVIGDPVKHGAILVTVEGV